MSDSPCTGCRSTNKGRLFYAYINHYVGDDLERRRVRLCKECVFEQLAPLLEGADYQEGREWATVETRFVQSTPTPIVRPVAQSSPVSGSTPTLSPVETEQPTPSAETVRSSSRRQRKSA